MLQRTETSVSPPPHLLGVVRSLWQWRKPILGVTVAGMLLSILIALLLPEYFLSRTSFVAISPEQVSIEGTFGAGNNRVQFYGTSEDIDRLLAIAESDEVIDFMVDSFDLYSVYKIDPEQPKAPVYVRKEFLGYYEVEKTPRDVIELSIEDRNPVRAAEMTRAARRRIDAIHLALIRSTHRGNAEGLRRDVVEREQAMQALNQQLSQLREESGIYNTEAQSEALSARLASLGQQRVSTAARLNAYRQRSGRGVQDSIAKLSVALVGLDRSQELLDSQLIRLNGSIGKIENLEEERLLANEQLSFNRSRLKQYETVLAANRSTLEVLEEARVPVVKHRPIRWLLVAGGTVVSFLFAVVGVLLIESGRRYDWASITR